MAEYDADIDALIVFRCKQSSLEFDVDIWDPGPSFVLCPVHGAHKPNSECYGCPQCRDAILADPPPRLVGPMGKSYMLMGHAYGGT